MKNLLSKTILFVALSLTTNVYAQEVQLATLQHGESMQVFYGSDALVNAMATAEHGDIITLSAGSFKGTIINKAVILQGAGYVTDFENGKFPTAIDFVGIQLQAGNEGLLIEGISFNNGTVFNQGYLVSCTFKKCWFSRLELGNSGGTTEKCLIDQCRIGDFHPDGESENLYVKNSYFRLIYGNSDNATLVIENCMMINIYNSVTALLKNNIIGDVVSPYANSSLKRTCTAYNNVFISGDANGVIIQSGNTNSDDMTLFGKTINVRDFDIEDYKLTPNAQVTFLGTDGTQVGLYGGSTPFTNIPSNPQITKRNIDAKTSVDGKLKVSITVEAQK